MKDIKKLGSITSFRIIFNWYVAKKPCAEMWLLKQSFQIIHRASFSQGNLTYHTFLWVKLQKIKIPFYRVVGTMYPLLSRLIYWLPDYVVDQNLHVSSLWLCHMVWHACHIYRDCAPPVIWFRPGEDCDLQVALRQQGHSHGDHWSTFIFTGKFIPALHHIILNPSKCI